MQELINEARKFLNTQKIPAKPQSEFATEIGKRLAKELGANVDIVEAGTLLMDSMLSEAYKQNKAGEHINMSLEKANEFLSQSSLSEEEKENIRHCVLDHHGAEKFYSLESEIVCNADCYKFISTKGFLISFRYTREMPFENLINLFKQKVDEKWNALSLDICKKELSDEHEILISMLKTLEK